MNCTIAGLLRSDDHTCSVFYTTSNNFSENISTVIIVMNKFILIQICINGSRQVNIFVSFVKTHSLKQKGVAP